MRQSFVNRLRGAARAIVLMAAASFSGPALADTSISTAAMARMVDSSSIISALEGSADGRVPVIVQFSAPEAAALAMQSASSTAQAAAAADAALTSAVHSAQSVILSRVLDLPDQGEMAAALASDALNIKRMDFSPMFAITADAALLERLAADPLVEHIQLDALDAPSLTSTLPLIGMPAAYAEGATGNGWDVAVLDTGGRRAHEFLNPRIVSAACYSNAGGMGGMTSLCPGGVPSSTALDSANDCDRNVIFGCGHGTHVAGTAAGFNASPTAGNPANGVARNARIISINVFTIFPRAQCGSIPAQYTGGCVLAYVSDQILGLERVYALRTTRNIAAVNMSLGGGQYFSACDSDSRKPIIDQLRAANIATVIAAGNNGYLSSLGAPACISSAIAVASSTRSDQRSSFSNWATMVDLVAPGSDILASITNGTSNNSYALLSGTSMAAPHVAGAFTALRSAVPAASVNQILTALQATGTPITVSGVTRGRINVDQALTVLRGGAGSNPTTTALTGPTSSNQGQSVTFTATVSATAGGTPTGTITFRNNGVSIGTRTLSSGSASFSTTSLPVGTNQITAAYGGSGTHLASVSSALTHTVTAAPGTRPVNDDFANRTNIPGPGTVTGSNVNATAETGEPLHHGLSGARNSVWWRYTPTTSGQITIDTDGSNFDTVLAVYTGSAVNALTYVASNDDAPGLGLRSLVQFNGQAGVSYAIAVAGFGTATGSITLNVAGGGGGALTPTTTSLAGPSSATEGQTVTFTATVSATTGTPTGTVTFQRDGSNIGTASLSSGTASFSTSSLPVGSHQIRAVYGGSTTHAGSTSAARTFVVNPAGGSDIIVNQNTSFNQRRPEISPLLRTAVVVFEDQRAARGPFGITAQRVTRMGRPLGDPVNVAAPARGTVFPHVAQLPGTGYVVVWQALGAGGTPDIFMRRFRPNGTALDAQPRVVNGNLPGRQVQPRVAGLSNGGFVVVWHSNRADGDGDGIVMRIFDASGSPRTGDILVNQTRQGHQRRADVTVQTGGDIVVSWAGPAASALGVYTRRFNATGAPLGGEVVVGQTASGRFPLARVASLINDHFAVAFEASDGMARPNPFSVLVQRLRPVGSLWGSSLPMERAMAGIQRTPAITGLRQMAYATAWAAPDGGANGIWMQMVGRNGAVLSGPTRVNSTVAGNQSQPSISRVGNSRLFFVVWTSPGRGGNEGRNILINRFQGP